MVDALAFFAIAVLGGVAGYSVYALHQENKKLIEKVSSSDREVIVPSFPENPEALVRDPDLVPLEEVSDREVQEAVDKMLQ